MREYQVPTKKQT